MLCVISTVLIFILLASSQVALALSHSTLRIDPHTYAGPRGGEPSSQLVGLARLRLTETKAFPDYDFKFHLEGEALGRRDVSVDIDRAWYRFSLIENSALYLGRLHPYDTAEHPSQKLPWGLLGTHQAQNRGVQLGYGYNPEENIPSPILLGWLGAHFWSDEKHQDLFQYGLSASPVFVPNLGSEVTLSVKDPASVGRFGRRPPGSVEVDGRPYAVRYEIDRTRIWEDVVLQPQAIAQVRLQSANENPKWIAWLSAQSSPNPDPSFDTSNYLLIKPDGMEAYIKAKPQFKRRNSIDLSQSVLVIDSIIQARLFNTLQISDDGHWGQETGISANYFSVSYLNEFAYRGSDTNYKTTEKNYLERLWQLDLKIPVYDFLFYGGIKLHELYGDYWTRAGVRWKLGQDRYLDSNFDLFHGGDETYFGEWRTNSRIALSLTWGVGI